MGRLPLLHAIVILTAITLCSPTVGAQPVPETILHDELDNVVRISSPGGGGGAGFIIGRLFDTLWITTAAHVVFSDTSDATGRLIPFDRIRVKLRGSPTAYELSGRPVLAIAHDLAFVPVSVPLATIGLDLWKQVIIEPNPKQGDPVRLAAMPSSIELGPWDGSLVRTPEGRLEIAHMIQSQRGQSGSPVLSGRGIVGMYVAAGINRMIPIGIIEEQAVKAGLPFLQSFPPRPTPVHLCVSVSGAASTMIVLNSMKGLSHLDQRSCADVMSGDVTIISADATLRCLPLHPRLTSEPEQALQVDCARDIDGIWNGGVHGVAKIQTSGEGSWTIDGLANSDVGWIKGEIVRLGSRFSFTGESQYAGRGGGSLTFSSDELSGTLTFVRGQVRVRMSR